jgi:hypothetical protein
MPNISNTSASLGDPNYVPLNREECDQFEREWLEHAALAMQASEIEWTQAGFAFAWLDPQPVYVSPIDWNVFIPEPRAPGRRMFRFTLIGGGQICAIEHWRRVEAEAGGSYLSDYPGPTLRVTAHVGDDVRRYRGEVKYGAGPGDMHAMAVLFRNTPQDIVDRVMATLRAIDCTPDNFYALLDGASTCAICGHALRDAISKLVGVGPDCARANDIPHSLEAASKRLQLRKQLLGELNADSTS